MEINLDKGQILKLKSSNEKFLSLRNNNNQWLAKSPTTKFKLKRKGDKYFLASKESTYRLKLKENKIKVYTQENNFSFVVKWKTDKIKISQQKDGSNPWELKLVKNGYKIVKDNIEIGKIKFYPEKGKIKVKDWYGAVIATMKSEKLFPSPAVALFDNFGDQEKLLIFTILSLFN